MEREQEITKLVNVLRKAARTAQMSEWTGSEEEATAYSAGQYNRVRARLATLDPGVEGLFDPLPEDTSLAVIAVACRQLAAYFEDEVGTSGSWGRVYGAAFDADSFKEFWRKSARDIEDLGEFIRENIEVWARQRKGKHPDPEDSGEDG